MIGHDHKDIAISETKKKSETANAFSFTKSLGVSSFTLDAMGMWHQELTVSRIINWKWNCATDSFTIQRKTYTEVATQPHCTHTTHSHRPVDPSRTRLGLCGPCAMCEMRIHKPHKRIDAQEKGRSHTHTHTEHSLMGWMRHRSDVGTDTQGYWHATTFTVHWKCERKVAKERWIQNTFIFFPCGGGLLSRSSMIRNFSFYRPEF